LERSELVTDVLMSANGMVRPCSNPAARTWQGTLTQEHAMLQKLNSAVAVIGIDIGKDSFHIVGHDKHGAIVLRQKWSRGQVETRLANMRPCLIGMEASVGAHHLSRKLQMLGHDARLMPATMKFVATKSFVHHSKFGSQ
jgi:transposase